MAAIAFQRRVRALGGHLYTVLFRSAEAASPRRKPAFCHSLHASIPRGSGGIHDAAPRSPQAHDRTGVRDRVISEIRSISRADAKMHARSA